jgi:hypothetical protein
MAKQSKKPADLNRLAAAIVGEATDQVSDPDAGKDPHAVALGRKGGKRGGRARADKLSPAERSDAARKAARARWDR